MLYTPTDTFSLLLNVHGRDYEGPSAMFRANIIEQGTGNLDRNNFDRDTVFFDAGNNNPQRVNGWGGSAKIDLDLGELTLTSITGIEDASSRSLGDIDGGFVGPNSFFDPATVMPPFFPDTIAFPAETQDGIEDLDQFTQEIRLASNSSGPFNWQVGFFYFDTDFQVLTVGPGPMGFPPATIVNHANDSWAIFGQATYDVSDRLNLTFGGRYTEDDRDFNAIQLPPGVTVNPTSVSDEDFSWDVSALYRAAPGFNLYARGRPRFSRTHHSGTRRCVFSILRRCRSANCRNV